MNLRWPRAFIILYSGEEIENEWISTQQSAPPPKVLLISTAETEKRRYKANEEIAESIEKIIATWMAHKKSSSPPPTHPSTVNTSLVFPFINQLTTTLRGICFSKNPILKGQKAKCEIKIWGQKENQNYIISRAGRKNNGSWFGGKEPYKDKWVVSPPTIPFKEMT